MRITLGSRQSATTPRSVSAIEQGLAVAVCEDAELASALGGIVGGDHFEVGIGVLRDLRDDERQVAR